MDTIVPHYNAQRMQRSCSQLEKNTTNCWKWWDSSRNISESQNWCITSEETAFALSLFNWQLLSKIAVSSASICAHLVIFPVCTKWWTKVIFCKLTDKKKCTIKIILYMNSQWKPQWNWSKWTSRPTLCMLYVWLLSLWLNPQLHQGLQFFLSVHHTVNKGWFRTQPVKYIKLHARKTQSFTSDRSRRPQEVQDDTTIQCQLNCCETVQVVVATSNSMFNWSQLLVAEKQCTYITTYTVLIYSIITVQFYSWHIH